jgi:predicted permease
VDQNVIAFSLALCVLTTILFGLLPAWNMSRISLAGSLHPAGRWQTDGPRGGRLRAALVSAEVGLTTLLLIGAGLLLASLHRVMNVQRGFATENTYAMVLALPRNKYQNLEQKVSFFRRVDESVASAPGIRQSGYANAVPLIAGESSGSGAPAVKEGSDDVAMAELPMASWLSVSSGYFSTLGIPLRAGRLFDEGEPHSVAVVSETAARRIWPGENPIGKKIRHWLDRTRSHWFTVIGVVGDVHSTALDRPPDCLIYYPYWRRYYAQGTGESILVLYVRTPIEGTAVTAAIREQVRNVDTDVSISDRGALAHIVSKSVSQRRFQALMVAAFGLVALLLAGIGVYGVVSYSIAQRRKEIGVRMVLGASQRDIASLVLRHGMRPVLVGMGIGVVAAAALARLIQSLLFEVRALNPLILTAAPLALVLVAALACYGPIRRGSRTDPVVALRYD